MSVSIRTEISWNYTPIDFFEAPYVRTTPEYRLTIEEGKALLTLSAPIDPVDLVTHKQLTKEVENVLRIRAIQVHKPYVLRSAVVSQNFPDGHRTNHASISGTARIVVSEQADFVVRDKDGTIVKDTRAERIQKETAFLDTVLSEISRSPTLEAAFESYYAAINDPANELVHLYEIRDAIAKTFRRKDKALKALNFSRAKWDRFGDLCSKVPLKQGRHRGRNIGNLQDATPAELEEARQIACALIDAYLNYLRSHPSTGK